MPTRASGAATGPPEAKRKMCVQMASPVWTPIRTLIGRSVGHASAAKAHRMARAAATAFGAEANMAKRPSHSPHGRMWQIRAIHDRVIGSGRRVDSPGDAPYPWAFDDGGR